LIAFRLQLFLCFSILCLLVCGLALFKLIDGLVSVLLILTRAYLLCEGSACLDHEQEA
jgi:hypothetical protein